MEDLVDAKVVAEQVKIKTWAVLAELAEAQVLAQDAKVLAKIPSLIAGSNHGCGRSHEAGGYKLFSKIKKEGVL